MLLDELVKESFDLDYEILFKQKNIDYDFEKINSLKSNEIKDLFSILKDKIEELDGLLQNCDSQRKVNN